MVERDKGESGGSDIAFFIRDEVGRGIDLILASVKDEMKLRRLYYLGAGKREPLPAVLRQVVVSILTGWPQLEQVDDDGNPVHD